jgi:hypothetical protein
MTDFLTQFYNDKFHWMNINYRPMKRENRNLVVHTIYDYLSCSDKPEVNNKGDKYEKLSSPETKKMLK